MSVGAASESTPAQVAPPPAPAGVGRDREFLSLLTARISEAYIRRPFYIDGALDLISACRLLADNDLTNALVLDNSSEERRIGMFTTTDLRDALLLPVAPRDLPVARAARYDLITVRSDAAVYDALLMMIRHRVHRLLVMDDDRVVGVLGQLDLMGFVSNHSHLIALQVAQAQTIDALRAAALQTDGLIAVLHDGGARIEVIASLVSEINSQVFARLWSLLASPQLVSNSCLIVMGSEGRGEQVLKTDQDNALLLRDGYLCTELADVVARFNACLIEFGYPPCPGDIMLTNTRWRQPVAAFRETVRQWFYGEAPDAAMHLAIFLDARCVAGDARLLSDVRSFLHGIASDSDAAMARFAQAVDQFGEPAGWWSRLASLRERDEEVFDLKKAGTFPIVHGVRALALQAHLGDTTTLARVRALEKAGRLGVDLARDLVDALHFLMGLKLRHNLRQRSAGEPVDNLVRLSQFGMLERDQLKDSLAIIKRFRQFLRQHFHLDLL